MREVKWIAPGGNISEPVKIRIAVFCDEQGYCVEQELDDTDQVAWHLLVLENGVPAATGRIYETQEKVMALGRIAVCKAGRGTGIGFFAVQQMLQKAEELGAYRVWLDAQSRVVGFYEKLGFTACGAEHMDGHVPHRAMEKELV